MPSQATTSNKVVLDQGWEGHGREAGILLRRYNYPITNCIDEAQRQGWLAEDKRKKKLEGKKHNA